jgi:hypothetical protein
MDTRMLIGLILGGWIGVPVQVQDAAIRTLSGTWAGPRWSETFIPTIAKTVAQERDFGSMRLRFDLDRDIVTGIASLQPASVDAAGTAWMYPPKQVPLTELELSDQAVSFKIDEGARWQRYRMHLKDPTTAELLLVSVWMRGHGEIALRPQPPTTFRRIDPSDPRYLGEAAFRTK